MESDHPVEEHRKFITIKEILESERSNNYEPEDEFEVRPTGTEVTDNSTIKYKKMLLAFLIPVVLVGLCWILMRGYLLDQKHNGKLIIDPSSLNQVKYEGDSLYVSCLANGGDSKNITWLDPNGNVIENSNRIHVDYRYLDHERAGLLFRNISKNDEGTYVCSLDSKDGSGSTAYFKLVVFKRLKFVDTPSDQFLEEGEDSTLVCNVIGEPVIKVSWMKDGAPLPTHSAKIGSVADHENWIVIKDATKSDEGKYVCEAVHFNREISHIVHRDINVQVRGPISFLDTPKEQVLKEGEKSILMCNVEGTPMPNVTWEVHGIPITEFGGKFAKHSQQPYWIVVQNVALSDQGKYTCKAEQRLTTQTSADFIETFKINVQVKPQLIIEPSDLNQVKYEGDSLYVFCSAKDIDPNDITWLDPRGNVIENSRSRNPNSYFDHERAGLVFRNISKKEEGTYNCSLASKDWSKSTVHFKLVVFKRLRFVDTPSDQFLEEGEDSTLVCNVIGEPVIIVSWMKDGAPLPTHSAKIGSVADSENWIVIKDATKSDEGKYVCEAVHLNSETSHIVHRDINVQIHEPISFLDTPVKQVLKEGENSVLMCNVRGTPMPSVTWEVHGISITKFGGKFVKHSQETHWIVVQNVALSDQGKYTCEAEQRLTTPTSVDFTETFEINVQVKPRKSTEPLSNNEKRTDNQQTNEQTNNTEAYKTISLALILFLLGLLFGIHPIIISVICFCFFY